MKTIEQRQEYFKKFVEKEPCEPYWPCIDRGFQVIITAHNEEEYIIDCLESVEMAMRGENWVMHFGNDGSTDNTLSLVKNFKRKSSATEFHIYDFKKAKNVAGAKNRTIQNCKKYAKNYPAILLHDGDDKMALGRAKGLYNFADNRGDVESSFIYLGDYVYCNNIKNYQDKITAEKAYYKLSWGPWATMIHADFIPDDGELFYEGVSVHEDLVLWREIVKAGISIVSVTGVNTCYYNAREGTLSKNKDVEKRKKIWSEHINFLKENGLEIEEPEEFEDPLLKNPLGALEFSLPEGVEILDTTGQPEDEESEKRNVGRIAELGFDEFIKQLKEPSDPK